MERWLSEHEFLVDNEITIADISAACELYQGKFIAMDLNQWPKVSAWLKRIVEDIPEVNEMHILMRKLAAISLK